MVEVGVLLVGSLLVLWVVFPIVSLIRATRAARHAALLRDEVASLGDEVTRLRQAVDDLRRPAAPTHVATATSPPVSAAAPPTHPLTDDVAARVAEVAPPPILPPLPAPSAQRPERTPPLSLEARIGAHWLLYAGIATLVLGSSYFIKYAFENEWITPLMRVVLGAAAGFALVVAGRAFSRRALPLFGQMLAGGGIAMLYLATYAALNVYGLIGPGIAFGLMAAVTALGVQRAHAERSQGLALLAIAGGFLTPFLVGGDARVPHVLFAYDALLVAGTLVLARHHAWPALHLVSFVLTGITIAAWADQHYRPNRWLSTELWITLFAALFALIWRTLPASTQLSAALARVVLGMTPFIYHLASVQILWRHAVGLLVYLIAATALGIGVAQQARRSSIRLLTFVLVGVPALGWFSTRPARWDIAAFVAVFAIYALHLVAQLRDLAERREPPQPLELLLLHGNGLWLWGAVALLVEKVALGHLGAVTFALAAWHSLLALLFIRRNRETTLHLLALGGALLAAGVAIEFDGAAITVAWACEGAALVYLGLLAGRSWLRFAGAALLAAAVVRLVQDLLGPAAVEALPLMNVRSLVALTLTALVALLAWRFRREPVDDLVLPLEVVIATLVITASALLLLWATSEVNAWFARGAWIGVDTAGAGAVTSAGLARQVALSTLWAGYGVLLVAVGIRHNYVPLRAMAIALLALTVGKVFLVDLARLDRFYRILSTVGLGLLLLGASYLYQRFTREHG